MNAEGDKKTCDSQNERGRFFSPIWFYDEIFRRRLNLGWAKEWPGCSLVFYKFLSELFKIQKLEKKYLMSF